MKKQLNSLETLKHDLEKAHQKALKPESHRSKSTSTVSNRMYDITKISYHSLNKSIFIGPKQLSVRMKREKAKKGLKHL